MRVFIRAVLFVLLSLGIWGADRRLRDSRMLHSDVAGVAQVNGGQRQWEQLQAIEREKSLLDFGAGAATVIAAFACFGTLRRRPGIRVVRRESA